MAKHPSLRHLPSCGKKGRGLVTKSCWTLLREQVTYSQAPWKSIHLERLVSGFPFLSWGQATWKAPGLCRGEAVGMQPEWLF